VVVTDKIMPTPQKKQKHYDRETLLKSPEPQVTQALKAAETDHNLLPGKEEQFSMPAEINEPLQMVLLLKPVFEKGTVPKERKGDVVLYEEKTEEKEADKAASARFKTKAMPSMVGSMSRSEAPTGEKLRKLHEVEGKGLSYHKGLLFNIMENIKNAGGRILKTDINNETDLPEYLLIEIPGQNYRKFIEKLAESGKIQTQPEGDVSQFKQPIQVRIHIILPN
ncbi:MAG: hypothetical protein R6V76_06730, partial [Desulfobacterales bacterium]